MKIFANNFLRWPESLSTPYTYLSVPHRHMRCSRSLQFPWRLCGRMENEWMAARFERISIRQFLSGRFYGRKFLWIEKKWTPHKFNWIALNAHRQWPFAQLPVPFHNSAQCTDVHITRIMSERNVNRYNRRYRNTHKNWWKTRIEFVDFCFFRRTPFRLMPLMRSYNR